MFGCSGSEDVAFARQARRQAGRPADVRQLQGDPATRLAVDPLGEPDRAHPALAELGEQAVGADRRARRCALACRCRAERELRQRPEEVVGLDSGGIAEELAQLGLDRIGLAQRLEPGVALGGSEREGFVETATDRRPVGGELLKIDHAMLVRCAKRVPSLHGIGHRERTRRRSGRRGTPGAWPRARPLGCVMSPMTVQSETRTV